MLRCRQGIGVSPVRSATAAYLLCRVRKLNGNGATVSREAAGITACLIAYSHHACRTENELMTEHFYRLRAYALHHPESHAIFALID